MSDAELEQLREIFYVLAETMCEVGEGRLGRSMRPNSILDTNDGQAYHERGRE